MSSRVFRGLSWRLLDAAQALMWENSSFTVLICLEPTRRYESSSYFIMDLGGRFACRSDAATTYDGGPITDVVRKIYYSHFLHQCTVAHGIKRLCKVRRDQQDVIILLKH